MVNTNMNLKAHSWAELDATALLYNYNSLKKAIDKKSKVMAVLKADAYGHGAVWVAKKLEDQGVDFFAVACLEEAIELRQNNVKSNILILGYTPLENLWLLEKYSISQTITDYDYALEISKIANNLNFHLKIDTGNHRLGIPYEDKDKICNIFQLPNLNITGIYSHLSRADSIEEVDKTFTLNQIAKYNNILNILNNKNINYGITHLQSTYGVINYPNLKYDYVRTGLYLYGVLSDMASYKYFMPDIKPVMSVNAKVMSIHNVENGEWVGYGKEFKCVGKKRIAALAIGYADGLPRNYKNGSVIINGLCRPIIGRISMDQITIMLENNDMAKAGDNALIIGGGINSETHAANVADKCGTISNEILSRIGKRVL